LPLMSMAMPDVRVHVLSLSMSVSMSVSVSMQHVHYGDVDIQQRYGHPARTWTCSYEMDMQNGRGLQPGCCIKPMI
jgi:hypothetical protein